MNWTIFIFSLSWQSQEKWIIYSMAIASEHLNNSYLDNFPAFRAQTNTQIMNQWKEAKQWFIQLTGMVWINCGKKVEDTWLFFIKNWKEFSIEINAPAWMPFIWNKISSIKTYFRCSLFMPFMDYREQERDRQMWPGLLSTYVADLLYS